MSRAKRTEDSGSYDKYRELSELPCLANVDEADDYEVDDVGIHRTPDGEFLLLSRSGCSCWDGEHTAAYYDNLEDIEADLLEGDADGNDVYRYNPSLNGAKQLIAEARQKLAEGN